jgi:hypothetical protein
MLRPTVAEPAPGERDTGSQSDRLGGAITSINRPRQYNLQQSTAPIRARLISCDLCEAEGRTVRAYAPVLAMCRELVAANYDPARPLEAYRGDMLCLKVRSIGEGAKYTVKDSSAGTPSLRRHQEPVLSITRASPVAPNVPRAW